MGYRTCIIVVLLLQAGHGVAQDATTRAKKDADGSLSDLNAGVSFQDEGTT
jgi:hypothetical protein